MKILKEVTEWADSTPNHTYILEGDKAVGYIRKGTDTVIKFGKPMAFDKRKRKFKEIKDQNILSQFG